MCNNPRKFKNIKDAITGKLYNVPCHRCQGCRIDRRKFWERRITSEFVKWRSAFVTLTYNDENLPYNEGAIVPTIRNNDVRKYIDRLRHRVNKLTAIPKLCTKKFHYVACTEYGSRTARPHIHLLLLGLDFKYFKKMITEEWGKGIVDCGPIVRGGIRYILKYMDTMQYGEYNLRTYTDTGRETPKMFFSKGLGKEYIISQAGNIAKYGTMKIGRRLVPCGAYWKNKLLDFTEENIEEIRKRNEDYTKQMDNQAQSLGYYSYEQMLKEMRQAKEYAYEKNKLKRKEAIDDLARHLNTPRMTPLSEFLNYGKSEVLDTLDKIQYK